MSIRTCFVLIVHSNVASSTISPLKTVCEGNQLKKGIYPKFLSTAWVNCRPPGKIIVSSNPHACTGICMSLNGIACIYKCYFSLRQKQVVIALSGIPNPGDGSYQAIPAQVQIFKENYDPSSKKTRKSFHNPKTSIGLEAAQVSVIGSQSQLSGRKLSKASALSCSFRVTTKEGTCYEFVADNESERLVWVTVLEFLAMFPYSSVPEVPKCNPVFSRDLEPSLYDAGGLLYT